MDEPKKVGTWMNLRSEIIDEVGIWTSSGK